jgi:hypothetical protein
MQDIAAFVQPPTTEEEVFWCLFGSTATVRTVCFAYTEEVCFVVSMAKLKLVEGTGSFLSCFHRDPELLRIF